MASALASRSGLLMTSIVLLVSVQSHAAELPRSRGVGTPFKKAQCEQFNTLYANSKKTGNRKVQWVLMDLDAPTKGVIVDSSSDPQQRIFGASTSKVFVAAALLDRKKGQLTPAQLGLMRSMIISSSNTAWSELQRQLGDGSWTLGQKRNLEFTQKRGYRSTRGFSGNIHKKSLGSEFETLNGKELMSSGTLHGNELTARDTTDFLFDTYRNAYAGAPILLKTMHSYRTGRHKGDKYIPSDIYVGGKTGTYTGSTITNGQPSNVSVRNIAMFFKGRNGKQYGLTVLANTGSDETSALIAGGLIRKYGGVQDIRCD